MAFADVSVRSLSIREKRNIKTYIRELRRLDRRRNPPSSAYRCYLEELLQGDYRHPQPIPSWLAQFWADEDLDDPQMAVLHDFDNIVLNADLARLGYFMRTGEGQTIKKYLKESFGRVTLAVDSSIYSLFDGDAGLVVWDSKALDIVEITEENPPVRDRRDALERLLKQIDRMTHVHAPVVEIVM